MERLGIQPNNAALQLLKKKNFEHRTLNVQRRIGKAVNAWAWPHWMFEVESWTLKRIRRALGH